MSNRRGTNRILPCYRWIAQAAFLPLLIIFLSVITYEKWPGIERRLFPAEYPWRQADVQYLDSLRSITKKYLDPGIVTPSFDLYQMNEGRTETFLRNLGKSKKRPLNFWPNACALNGLWISYRFTGSTDDLAAIQRFVDKVIDETGEFREDLQIVDQCMIGEVLLDLYGNTGLPRYRTACDRIAHFLFETHPKSSSGLLPYRRGQSELMLVDTLAMVCPFLAAYGQRFGSPEASDIAVRQMDEFLRLGMDDTTGLPCHGYRVPDGHIGVIGWLRGTGWLCLGLAGLLEQLPKEDPSYDSLAEQYRVLMERLRAYQSRDGGWPWLINMPENRTDTSGTAMIAYAVEKGVEQGLLKDEFYTVSEKALQCLVSRTDQYGMVQEAQAECYEAGLYPGYFKPAEWVQGPTTALCAVVLQRQNLQNGSN